MMLALDGRHLVSTEWLAAHLDAQQQVPGLVVLDGSTYLPTEKRDPRREYEASHIPGARFFDIDAHSDHTTPLPHMLPSPESFAAAMGALGIGEGDTVVAYDASATGMFSAARVWWTMRVFGHANVAVLDGGMKKWVAEGRAVTAAPATRRAAKSFVARPERRIVRTIEEMRAHVAAGDVQIVDARAARRFQGLDPEPRPGLRSGHMPGARSVPFTTLLAGDGSLKPAAELEAVFERAGVDVDRPIVTSCGSGVTAAVLSLALAVLGRADHGLYDGSWSEWGQASLDTEVATGG